MNARTAGDPAMDVLWEAETAPIEWLQGLGDRLVGPMAVVTELGSQTFVIALLALIFWSVNSGLGARLFVLAVGTGVLNHLLKGFVYGARPSWYSAQIAQHATESSFGMPSGHAQGSTVLWGYLGVASGRRALLWAAIGLIALICLSRVYLGVHFISDIVVGVLLGVATLRAFLRWEDRVLAWWRRLDTVRWVAVAAAVSLTPCLIGAAWRYLARDGWEPPAEWIGATPLDPAGYTLAGLFGLSGALLGGLVGFTLLDRRGWYSAEGPLSARAARFVLGISVVVSVLVFTDLVFVSVTGPTEALLAFLTYVVVAFWASFGAPELFLRSGLARRPSSPRDQGEQAEDRADGVPGA
ncbi:phosphatase PAP2 family protein [Nocardiopsis lambiniae]|uniref:Phosphatase PAP2 family protein n=1 Tax=Nocardiopsis lambiniae TaxID=3075539 RepID=A0ABU2M4N3_9ACTN|nr:phosphatase PAP2 family protein [Nocardiopsis sp. DSM 44743]MDT0327281.1 phosphatase PAP2 family protein [Nocardiopsis sp. DSM 44743]